MDIFIDTFGDVTAVLELQKGNQKYPSTKNYSFLLSMLSSTFCFIIYYNNVLFHIQF